MATPATTAAASAAATTAASTRVWSSQALIDFVVHEARLLDDQAWDEWGALFADDGIYWVPLGANQVDPVNEASLMNEDALLRRLRIERLRHPRAHSLRPTVRCHHLLQVPVVEVHAPEANRYVLRTEFHYTERQRDSVQFHVGRATHELRDEGGQLKIVLKRVDLLDADTALPMIQLFI